MAVNGSDNSVYVTGVVANTLDNQAFAGVVDIALLRYDTAGVWQWTRLKGTSTIDRGFGGEPYDPTRLLHSS